MEVSSLQNLKEKPQDELEIVSQALHSHMIVSECHGLTIMTSGATTAESTIVILSWILHRDDRTQTGMPALEDV